MEITLPSGGTVGDLAEELLRVYPQLGVRPGRLVVAVNHEYREHDYPLSDGDEVALIPPVSGGADD